MRKGKTGFYRRSIKSPHPPISQGSELHGSWIPEMSQLKDFVLFFKAMEMHSFAHASNCAKQIIAQLMYYMCCLAMHTRHIKCWSRPAD